jgi:tetratricopeptide (TPR) repeat protein
MSYVYDAFLSYRHIEPDKTQARELLHDLEAVGYKVAIDERDFGANLPVLQEMERCVEQSRFTVALITSRYLESGFIEQERLLAIFQDLEDSARRFIPLFFDEVAKLPRSLRMLTGIRFNNSDSLVHPLERLKRSLGPPLSADRLEELRPLRLWNVPYEQNPYFTGREQVLHRLRGILLAGSEAAISQPPAISGLGGIGKTQTAVEYAYRYAADYRAVLWVRADTELALREGFLELAHVLGMPQATSEDTTMVVAAVRHWLEGNKDWLLILDNVDRTVMPVVHLFMPRQRPGHILITTQTPSVGLIGRIVTLEEMKEEEGAVFLLRRAGILERDTELSTASMEDRNSALALSRDLGGLPLALDQAGAYIDEMKVTPKQYQVRFSQAAAAVLGRRGELSLQDHPLSVSATFALALSEVRKKSVAAEELVQACAFLAPDAIPEEIFIKGATEFGRELQAVADDAVLWDDTVKIACTYSLLTRSPENQTLDMHRLVQAVLRFETVDDQRRNFIDMTIRAINATFPVDLDYSNWPLCEQLTSHALVCLGYWIEDAELVCNDGARLLHRLGQYLYARARYDESEHCYRAAIEAYDRVTIVDRHAAILTWQSLATLYRRQGRYAEAEPLCTKALGALEESPNSDPADIASAQHDLATLNKDQGRYAEAEPLLKSALAIRERIGHRDTALTLHKLADLYRAEAKYAEAEAHYRRALELQELTYGPHHPYTASTMQDLAVLYVSLERGGEAEVLYSRALRIKEDILGPTHPYTAGTLQNLANLFREQGRLQEAETHYFRALDIKEKALGGEHPYTASILQDIGKFYHIQRNYREAEQYYARALNIWEKALGPVHPDTAATLQNLAVLYDEQDKGPEAEGLYRRALAAMEKALGPSHPKTETTRSDLSAFLRRRKRQG